MPYCPNCGTEVGPQVVSCPRCGVDLAGGQPGGRGDRGATGDRVQRGAGSGNRQTGPRQGDKPGTGHRQHGAEPRQPGAESGHPGTGRGRQGTGDSQRGPGTGHRPGGGAGHQSGGGAGPQSGAVAGNHPGDGPGGQTRHRRPAGGGGLSRRHLLAGGGALALAAGGWVLFTQVLGESGPAAVVEEFVTALDAGNVERANALWHPDSPEGPVSDAAAERFDDATITGLQARVVRQSEDEAVVEVSFTIGAGADARDRSFRLLLRTYEGEWRIWGE